MTVHPPYLGALLLIAWLTGIAQARSAPAPTPLVRIAELEIDPAQIAAYEAAVSEEIDISVRVEPGVLAIYSVALKDSPTHLRFFEIYADEAAYQRHLSSPHFRKYVEVTKPMIRSRRLFETVPVRLGAKPAYAIAVERTGTKTDAPAKRGR